LALGESPGGALKLMAAKRGEFLAKGAEFLAGFSAMLAH
jgi:hypothetical protein